MQGQPFVTCGLGARLRSWDWARMRSLPAAWLRFGAKLTRVGGVSPPRVGGKSGVAHGGRGACDATESSTLHHALGGTQFRFVPRAINYNLDVVIGDRPRQDKSPPFAITLLNASKLDNSANFSFA